MKVTLTANAGVLIELDGIRILLDGVCEETSYYLGTPKEIKKELSVNFPDAVGFTHKHIDHYDEEYANLYKLKTLRPILGSECSDLMVDGVELTAFPTRHIGKWECEHKTIIITGSRCIWFMGDSSPNEFKNADNLPKPDLIIAPFAYFNTESAWSITQNTGAKEFIIVHLPDKNNDPFNLWEAVKNTTKNEKIRYFSEIGDTITLF